MAIDTKAKRMSMLTFASPLAWQHHFEVDGAVDADDRAHLLHLYGGNALSSPGGDTNRLLLMSHIRNHSKGLTGGML